MKRKSFSRILGGYSEYGSYVKPSSGANILAVLCLRPSYMYTPSINGFLRSVDQDQGRPQAGARRCTCTPWILIFGFLQSNSHA